MSLLQFLLELPPARVVFVIVFVVVIVFIVFVVVIVVVWRSPEGLRFAAVRLVVAVRLLDIALPL